MPFPNAIHLGFAKCGSTFLQAFWRQHPQVQMVFKANFFAPLVEGSFAHGPEYYSQQFSSQPFSDSTARKTIIESDEHMLMGLLHPVLGVRGLTIDSVNETCLRMKSVVPEAKLLLVVRNQLEMMVSTYSQYLLGGGTLSLDHFAEEFMHCSQSGVNYFDFDFDQIVQIIEDHFPGKLKVVLAEELARDTDTQLGYICEFLNIEYMDFDSKFRDRRVGLSRVGMPFVRGLNHFVVRRHSPRFEPDYWIPRPVYKTICNVARVVEHYALRRWTAESRYELASRELKEMMRERFAASNARFGERIGKDLDRWAYTLPTSSPAPERTYSESLPRTASIATQSAKVHTAARV